MKKNVYCKLTGIILLISFVLLFCNIGKVYAEEVEEAPVKKLIGDFNGDGKKDVTDLLIMLRHIAASKNEVTKQKYPEWYKEDKIEEMDLNQDSRVDVTDCLALQRHIAANKNAEIAFKHPEWLIKDIEPDVLKLNIEKVTISLEENKEVQLIPYIASTNEEIFTNLTWESSNPEVATVNSTGKVTGISEGTAIIKVSAKNATEATCEVTVEEGTVAIAPEAISLDKSNLELELKQSKNVKLQYRISPSNANTDIQVEWISSNPDVVNVDEYGKITPKAKGEAVITVKTANEKIATCNVLVKDTDEVIEIYPESLQNDTPEIRIALNENAYSEMKTQIIPSNANVGTTITYSSSDTSIAQVDDAGIVRGIKEGTCTITATTENGKTTQSTVIIENSAIAPQEIRIQEEGPIVLEKENTVKLTVVITPDNANVDTGLRWESSDEEIASVDSNGVVKANKEGSCTITVTTENGKTANIIINVEAKKIVPTKVDIVAVGSSDLPNVKVDEVVEMQATITPSNANADTDITWTSSDEKVAVVDEKGMVQAKTVGECSITATTGNGKSASYHIKVIASSEPVEILPTGVEIVALGDSNLPNVKVDETVEMQATITPSNATNKSVTWSSSNESVAVVNAEGIVRARAVGNCTITVTTVNGKTASYQINVISSSEPVEILPTKVEVVAIGDSNLPDVKVNATIQMQATITPSNATNKTVTWSSSNDNIAVINAEGMVRARAVGNCTITATTVNGKTASYEIHVITDSSPTIIEPSSISIQTGGQTTLEEKQTKQLSVLITPSNANTNTAITWQSSDTRIATVNSNGLVTAVKEGTCTITATTKNGKTNTCTITVRKERIYPTGVTIQATGTTTLRVNGTVALNAQITPSNATDGTALTWASSNSNVAVVNNQGLVQAKGAGTCTITATTANGKEGSCTIIVEAEPQDTTAPVIEVSSSYDGYAITGGSTVTYNINIKEDNLKTFDTSKVKLTGYSAIDEVDNNIAESDFVSKARLSVTGSGKNYVATVTVPDEVGRIRLEIAAGAAVDQSNNQSAEFKFHNVADYVCKVNTAPIKGTNATGDALISTVIDAGNSFYTKSFQFALNGSVGSRTERTTNEWVYTGLNNGGKYTVGCHVEFYTSKENDTTVQGYVQKEVTIPTAGPKNLRIHFMNISRNVTSNGEDESGDGDSMLVITPNNETILIDCGKYENGTQKVDAYIDNFKDNIPQLKPDANGVVTIDYYFSTHSHNDHIGGFRGLTGWWSGKYNASNLKTGSTNGKKRRYEFRNIIVGCNYNKQGTDNFVTNLTAYANNKKINIIKVMAGNCLNIDGVLFNIFNPYPITEVPIKWLDTKNKNGRN